MLLWIFPKAANAASPSPSSCQLNFPGKNTSGIPIDLLCHPRSIILNSSTKKKKKFSEIFSPPFYIQEPCYLLLGNGLSDMGVHQGIFFFLLLAFGHTVKICVEKSWLYFTLKKIHGFRGKYLLTLKHLKFCAQDIASQYRGSLLFHLRNVTM